ncbi:L,D-transpeptidase family protein [Streptomyces sp. NRRL S-87]|uniref:L,D-transpeptidase family protein n=1 Tax=Streptomyces sp. NRRL S-87 TaxID=1463920 RepID=UPI0004C05340|nr:L,D-transpeptidase family protein [Streptomyces sp. NRRL S-87]
MSEHARTKATRSRPRDRRRGGGWWWAAAAAGIAALLGLGGWAYVAHDGPVPHRAAAGRPDGGGTAPGGGPASPPPAPGGRGAAGPPGRAAPPHPGPPRAATPGRIPGISPATRGRIPADSLQAVVVRGDGEDSSYNTVTLYTRTPGSPDWTPGPSWNGRNGANGWSVDRRGGDLTSPVGVFRLTDAGGLLPPPPGTRLPYDENEGFVASGLGVEGESLEGSFDHVVAIDFNRVPGTSPLDPEKPEGEDKGGNIWLHVDHDGPSQGCVGIPKQAMETLLRTLDPARRPVIVMGPAGA